MSTQYTKVDQSVDSVNNSATMTLTEAHELAAARGYKSSSTAFSSRFTKNKHDKDYQSYGIARITQGKGKLGAYIDV